MTPASHRLRRAIIERRSDTPRRPNWPPTPPPSPGAPAAAGGIDKSEHSAKHDAIIALSMALDRAEQHPEPVRRVG
jgi:hypothetical protein